MIDSSSSDSEKKSVSNENLPKLNEVGSSEENNSNHVMKVKPTREKIS